MLALGLVQLAWIAAVVPFRAIDEQQHVFKAEAVAHGDLSPHHAPAPDDGGQLVSVPDDIVAAARTACGARDNTTPALCHGTPRPGGRTLIASAAATYNPSYYALVGVVALPFHGTAALYAMRIWSALLCAVVSALAMVLLLRRRRRQGMVAAILLVLSPIWGYTSVVVAPNGLEMAAAFLLWACLLRLGSSDPPISTSWLAGLATAAATTLALLRTLGPLWCVVIVVISLLVAEPGRARAALVSRAAWRRAAFVAAAAGAAVAWSLVAGTNSLEHDVAAYPGAPWRAAVASLPEWLRQSIAAFPGRNELAAPVVYLVVVAMWAVAVARVLRLVRGRELVAWVLLACAVVGVPLAFVVLTWTANGDVWQGRYCYPITMGLMLVGGYALSRREPVAAASAPMSSAWLVTAGLALVTAVSLAGVLHSESLRGATFDQVGLPSAPLWLLITATTVGTTLLTWQLGDVAGQASVADTRELSRSAAA